MEAYRLRVFSVHAGRGGQAPRALRRRAPTSLHTTFDSLLQKNLKNRHAVVRLQEENVRKKQAKKRQAEGPEEERGRAGKRLRPAWWTRNERGEDGDDRDDDVEYYKQEVGSLDSGCLLSE